MDNTMTWVIIAVGAIVVIGVVALLARNARNQRRHVVRTQYPKGRRAHCLFSAMPAPVPGTARENPRGGYGCRSTE